MFEDNEKVKLSEQLKALIETSDIKVIFANSNSLIKSKLLEQKEYWGKSMFIVYG